MKRNKALRYIILDKIDKELDGEQLVRLATRFIVITVIIAVTIMVLSYNDRMQNCIDTVIQQYPNAPVEELKQRIELCHM